MNDKGRGARWVASPKSTTGYYGVDFHKASKKFRARVMVLKKRYDLGMFDTAERQTQPYLKLSSGYQKTHTNHLQPSMRFK